MSQPDDETRLGDMLDYACRAVEAIRDRSREDLDRDGVLAAGLERFVEVIGEAASRVIKECEEALPDIPWRQIVGMRNRLIHGYVAVDPDVLWDVVHDDLPAFITTLRRKLSN